MLTETIHVVSKIGIYRDPSAEGKNRKFSGQKKTIFLKQIFLDLCDMLYNPLQKDFLLEDPPKCIFWHSIPGYIPKLHLFGNNFVGFSNSFGKIKR